MLLLQSSLKLSNVGVSLGELVGDLIYASFGLVERVALLEAGLFEEGHMVGLGCMLVYRGGDECRSELVDWFEKSDEVGWQL